VVFKPELAARGSTAVLAAATREQSPAPLMDNS
jgi:hypothetical protein